jgi:hypothetical protein
MAFDGSEGQQITKSAAQTATANYRTNNPGAVLAHYIGRDLIDDILAQTDCQGIRAYYAEDNNGNRELIFVGVDSDENDQVDGVLADRVLNCPTNCSNANILNGYS